MKRSHWPHPGVRRHSKWIDLGLAVLLGAILVGQAVQLTSAPPAAGWATVFAR